MSSEVAVTSWAVWSAGGVSVNEAPVPGGGHGLGPWPDRPAPTPRCERVRFRRAPRHWFSSSRQSCPLAAHGLSPTLPARSTSGSGPGPAPARATSPFSRAWRNAAMPSVRRRSLPTRSPPRRCGEVSLALGLRGALSTVSSGEVSGLTAVVTGAASVSSGSICSLSLRRNGRVRLGVGRHRPVSARARASRPRTRPGWWAGSSLRSRPGSPLPADSVRSTMERLAFALATARAGEVGASSCPGATLPVSPSSPASRSDRQAGQLAGSGSAVRGAAREARGARRKGRAARRASPSASRGWATGSRAARGGWRPAERPGRGAPGSSGHDARVTLRDPSSWSRPLPGRGQTFEVIERATAAMKRPRLRSHRPCPVRSRPRHAGPRWPRR